MGNSAWVCFDCRQAIRRPTDYRGDVPCPACGKSCRCLGYKIPVPPKRNARAWQQLRASLDDRAVRSAEARFAHAVRTRHTTEQEIRRLAARPANAGRAKAIRLLKRQMGDG